MSHDNTSQHRPTTAGSPVLPSADSVLYDWLTMLCAQLDGVVGATVFGLGKPSEPLVEMVTTAKDPNLNKKLKLLAENNRTKTTCSLLSKIGRKTDTGEPTDVIICPLSWDQDHWGLLTLQLTSRVAARRETTQQIVRDAAHWLTALTRQRLADYTNQFGEVTDLVATALAHDTFQAAAIDAMTELTRKLSCDRVSFGLLHRQGSVRIQAVSHSGHFDPRARIFADISEAMVEAMEQNSTMRHPAPEDQVLLNRCHLTLSREHNLSAMLTIPFAVGGKIVGCVLAERAENKPFTEEEQGRFSTLVTLLGPMLAIRHQGEQNIPSRLTGSLHTFITRLFGHGHAGLKASLTLALFLLCFFTFASGEYRVTSKARLEARTQQVIVAPQDGYIGASSIRPGDIVRQGDQLGSLDDRELLLEQRQLQGLADQLRKEYRDALARHNRAETRIQHARLLQATAKQRLVAEQLARTRLSAPFDGVIVQGDLSQSIGAPVERGQVLFIVAPLLDYRIILDIDERDIDQVGVGQHGELALSSMPHHPLPFTLEQITPVSSAGDGRNVFRVEASLMEKSDLLRPGMEGVAKVSIEERRLLWIWTHRLVDWLRLTFWSLRP